MFFTQRVAAWFFRPLSVTLTSDVSASDLTVVRASVCDDRADLIL